MNGTVFRKKSANYLQTVSIELKVIALTHPSEGYSCNELLASGGICISFMILADR